MNIDEDLLRRDMTTALKAKDSARVQVIRSLIAAAKNRAIELRVERLTDAELTAVLKREAKQRAESLTFARKAGREDLVAEHEAAMVILEHYLPRQMSDMEIRQAVQQIAVDTGTLEIGPVMKELGKRYGGRYDGKVASAIVVEMTRTGER